MKFTKTLILFGIAAASALGVTEMPAELLKKDHLGFSPRARDYRVSGDVELRLVLDERGRVTRVKVVKGHPLLLETAVPAARRWRFAPATVDGHPVPSETPLIFKFVRE